MPKNTDTKHIREAVQTPGQLPYTIETVAQFHGWTKQNGRADHKCRVAFDMLDAVNGGVVSREQLKGLSREAASQIVTSAMAIKRENERVATSKAKQAEQVRQNAESYTGKQKQVAIEVASDLERQSKITAKNATKQAKQFAAENAEKVREGKRSMRDVRDAASEIKAKSRKQDRLAKVKDANRHIADYTDQVAHMLNKNDELHKSMLMLLKGDFGLEQSAVQKLRKEIDSLAIRANRLVQDLDGWQPKRQPSDAA